MQLSSQLLIQTKIGILLGKRAKIFEIVRVVHRENFCDV